MENENMSENGRMDLNERADKVKERVRDMSKVAMNRMSDTPTWVWAVIAGVVLLVVGLMAANRYRGYPTPGAERYEA